VYGDELRKAAVTCCNSIVEIGFSNQQRSHATMKKDTVVELRRPETGRDLLTAMLQEAHSS